jgi:hypothetical protein
MSRMRTRLDRLEEGMGVSRLWDGATSVDLLNHGYYGHPSVSDRRDEAPDGVRRMALFLGLIVGLFRFDHPGRNPDAPSREEVCEMLGLDPDVTTREDLVDRMMEIARERFRPDEVARLEKTIGRMTARLET